MKLIDSFANSCHIYIISSNDFHACPHGAHVGPIDPWFYMGPT